MAGLGKAVHETDVKSDMYSSKSTSALSTCQ